MATDKTDKKWKKRTSNFLIEGKWLHNKGYHCPRCGKETVSYFKPKHKKDFRYEGIQDCSNCTWTGGN